MSEFDEGIVLNHIINNPLWIVGYTPECNNFFFESIKFQKRKFCLQCIVYTRVGRFARFLEFNISTHWQGLLSQYKNL